MLRNPHRALTQSGNHTLTKLPPNGVHETTLRNVKCHEVLMRNWKRNESAVVLWGPEALPGFPDQNAPSPFHGAVSSGSRRLSPHLRRQKKVWPTHSPSWVDWQKEDQEQEISQRRCGLGCLYTYPYRVLVMVWPTGPLPGEWGSGSRHHLAGYRLPGAAFTSPCPYSSQPTWAWPAYSKACQSPLSLRVQFQPVSIFIS